MTKAKIDHNKVTLDTLKDLYKYHSEMETRSLDSKALSYHKGAKRHLLEVMTLVNRGNNTIWNSWCYTVI